MKSIGKGKDDSPDITDYRGWPLFKEFRKTPEFLTLFEEIFGEPLNRVTVNSFEAQPEVEGRDDLQQNGSDGFG